MDVDFYLSDVHVGDFGLVSEEGTTVSRFVLCRRQSSDYTDVGALSVDEDGDILVARRFKKELTVFQIEHAMATPIGDVGQQVWKGALQLADYVVHNAAHFTGAAILELGAGTGLASLVAGTLAKRVFSTDVGQSILDICQRNVSHNLTTLMRGDDLEILVRELDWTKPFQATGAYSWTDSDYQKLKDVSCIIAADVVYDNSITDAFFQCLVALTTKVAHSVCILISLEKRINFTLENMAPASPAYQYFRHCLSREYTDSLGRQLIFSARQLGADFPQSFEYERVEQLELWELTVQIC
ncbi:hypothetical protein EMCRGX_G027698 [Ephydatia muelleri]